MAEHAVLKYRTMVICHSTTSVREARGRQLLQQPTRHDMVRDTSGAAIATAAFWAKLNIMACAAEMVQIVHTEASTQQSIRLQWGLLRHIETLSLLYSRCCTMLDILGINSSIVPHPN